MRILLAPDKFKETATAAQVAAAMARGIQRIDPAIEVDVCPMADGGEGTVEALVTATGGEFRTSAVAGPQGEPVHAKWSLLGRCEGEPLTAAIEMSAASGLALVPPNKRDPLMTTTLGTGMLIARAVEAGARRIIVGIGGSATTDGGVGMAIGAGVAAFDDHKGRSMVKPIPFSGWLCDIGRIRHDAGNLRGAQVIVACDVTNPLYGFNGAAAVYGPQKGASPLQVELLDRGLRHLASLLPHVDANQPGMGAAGGLGFGLVAFCGARLERGIQFVMEAVGFHHRVAAADLVITGEGRLDFQSFSGKTCMGVGDAARQAGVPAMAIVGSLGYGWERAREHGFIDLTPLEDGDISRELAMRDTLPLIEYATIRRVRRWLAADERM